MATLINKGRAIQNFLFGMISVPVFLSLNFMITAPMTKYETSPSNMLNNEGQRVLVISETINDVPSVIRTQIPAKDTSMMYSSY